MIDAELRLITPESPKGKALQTVLDAFTQAQDEMGTNEFISLYVTVGAHIIAQSPLHDAMIDPTGQTVKKGLITLINRLRREMRSGRMIPQVAGRA